jgi:dienelactone hydrolase
MMKKALVVLVALAVLVEVALWLWPTQRGASRLFTDQAYHFETLRALGYTARGGADINEVLITIGNIPQGDDEQWFEQWEDTAERLEKAAAGYRDSVSRGGAFLRAHNYYRTAEFFLAPEDPRREASFGASCRTFYKGLDALGVNYRPFGVPYQGGTLKATYFQAGPGAENRPLIMACGGYDSTMEELYLVLASAALERGYDCLVYEGPGQGSVLREQGMQFTPQWEKPTGAVLDQFQNLYPRPRKIVLVGMSLGGYLAPRAAAFDPRINGVVAFDVCYDFQQAALEQVPGVVLWLHRNGMRSLVDWLIGFKMKLEPGLRWGVNNARWTMGAQSPSDLLSIFAQYNLRDVAKQIRADVLILAGEEDHFFPVEQVTEFKNALVNAHSVTARVFTRREGGHEHCQVGAIQLFHAELFEWLDQTFAPGAVVAQKSTGISRSTGRAKRQRAG